MRLRKVVRVGRRSTTGNRVGVDSVSRVRIPHFPPQELDSPEQYTRTDNLARAYAATRIHCSAVSFGFMGSSFCVDIRDFLIKGRENFSPPFSFFIKLKNYLPVNFFAQALNSAMIFSSSSVFNSLFCIKILPSTITVSTELEFAEYTNNETGL